ncbi:hypothetical protein ACE3MZ_11610 [Paenibacillus sp. WLX1005]|uniref:hypothetical protein n=1 Tax=Paenibacillus sp. WLX1005 TaxID=3243766 RepID=UPI0039842A01
MNKMTIPAACVLLAGVVLVSGCGKQTENTTAAPQTSTTEQQGSANSSSASNESTESATETNDNNEAATASDPSASSDDILIIIDQSEKPIENAGSFDFFINRLPKGYHLDKMTWTGKGKAIVNTYEQAVENGGSGGPEQGSFYISGDGQFSGFLYPESRKGEQGTVSFTFTNDSGNELSWEKKLTLK